MARALLYYRTLTTLSDTVGAETPADLLANHDSQVLEFDFPDNLLEGTRFSYKNNIVNIPAPTGDGTRKISKIDNGLRSISLVIRGVFKNDKTINADITKLESIASRKQTDGKHVYGIIGFFSPNAPNFSKDPNATTGSLPAGKATLGYTLDGFELGHVGQQSTRYDFQIEMTFGGIFT